MARLQEGDWHQDRITPKLGHELLLPELVSPPLAGAFVLETPIEPHFDCKHISAFYGGYCCDFNVQLSIIPFPLDSFSTALEKYLCKLKW